MEGFIGEAITAVLVVLVAGGVIIRSRLQPHWKTMPVIRGPITTAPVSVFTRAMCAKIKTDSHSENGKILG